MADPTVSNSDPVAEQANTNASVINAITKTVSTPAATEQTAMRIEISGVSYVVENAPANLQIPPNTRLATLAESDDPNGSGAHAITLPGPGNVVAWLIDTVEPAVQPATDETSAETARLSAANVKAQANIVVSTQTFDDGSSIQTFGDGSTLVTDSNGNQTFNSVGQPVYTDGSNTNTTSISTTSIKQKANAATPVTDWRVKLSLAKGSKYLYNAATSSDILWPLQYTDGVVFPYTPTIQTAYRANYDPADLTHSNYKMFFYRNSNVDDISISCDFTAQDNAEANYLLAVIHFFKSATKMFYGQDGIKGGVSAGTPPPLVYLSGYGQYQFNNHPMLISSFTYSLPNDVDYIRASFNTSASLSSGNAPKASYNPGIDYVKNRLFGSKLNPGGAPSQPTFNLSTIGETTYVPTKIQLSINCLPVVTRNDISNNFSLADYATGKLLLGNNRGAGGIW